MIIGEAERLQNVGQSDSQSKVRKEQRPMPERSTYLSESKILPENKWPRLPFGKHSKVDGYSPEYLARKAQVQTEFVTLSSGVKWAYFQEGDRSGVPLLCLHGGGESKWMWLQKEPIPGVWMIALDRPGYGDSGDPPMKQVEYTFEHILKDIGEFCDKLGIDQFVPCGFSIGTSWAMQTAVYYPKRVRGIILFGTMADTGHPDCPKKLVSKIGKPPKIMDPNGGCLGFILRGAFSGPCKEYQKYNFSAPIKDDAKDPRCATRFQEWMNDPFWVAMKVDDCLGFNRPEALLGDAIEPSSAHGHTTSSRSSAPSTSTPRRSTSTWAPPIHTRLRSSKCAGRPSHIVTPCPMQTHATKLLCPDLASISQVYAARDCRGNPRRPRIDRGPGRRQVRRGDAGSHRQSRQGDAATLSCPSLARRKVCTQHLAGTGSGTR